MEGGRIIGEGVDGCVLTEPMWPCSADSMKQGLPTLDNKDYISKITLKTDMEGLYRNAATRLLGPLASRYLTVLQGECSPADSKHPAPRSQMETFKATESSVLQWKPTGEACGDLKNQIQKGKPISESHKIMYISKYLINVKEWILRIKKPLNQVTQEVIPAIRPFLEALQMLYQQDDEQLIHIDLHIGNMFVKPTQGKNPLQFGLTDFGHCLLRRSSDTKEKQAHMFFGKYLCDYVGRYEFYTDFSQVPLESRILNFCFIKNLENVNPGSLVKSWEFEVNKMRRNSKDLVVMEVNMFVENLLKKPLFIAMVEQIQQICKKLRANLTDRVRLVQSLSFQEQIVLEYILTRYACISPINTITEGIMMLPSLNASQEAHLTVHSYFGKKDMKLRSQDSVHLTYLIDFLTRAIMAPYEQHGSSLSAVLASVQGGDLRIVWDDVIKS